MSLLKRLFGSGGRTQEPAAEPETHKDFRIFPEPAKESGGFRIAARIEKDVDGQLRTHNMIRADVCASLDEAEKLSLAKARQMIDEQGTGLFG